MRRILLAPFVAVFLLASCGDDDDTSAAQEDEISEELAPYADALATSFAVEDLADDFTISDDDADCVANRSAEVIGLERFEGVGDPDDVVEATQDELSVFELDQEELDQISETLLDCVDNAEQALRDTFLDAAQLDDEQAECVGALVDRELLVRILSTGIGGQDPETALADIQDDFVACL